MTEREGLRERKRARLRAQLLRAATDLFRERGFEATPVRAILEDVEISEATFFNYFPTKEAVLGAWAHDRVVDSVGSAGDASGRGRSDARARLRRLAAALERERVLTAQAWPRLRLGDRERWNVWAPLLEAAQQRGEVRADVTAAELGGILGAALDVAIVRWIDDRDRDDDGDRAGTLARPLQRAADLVLDGCRKRNERVRASAAGRATPPRPGPPPTGPGGGAPGPG